MNKHGVSLRWFTEADVKDFKSGALRTITNITRSTENSKKKSSQMYFKDFVHTEQNRIQMQNNFIKCKFLRRYFSRILFIDSELPNLKNGFL